MRPAIHRYNMISGSGTYHDGPCDSGRRKHIKKDKVQDRRRSRYAGRIHLSTYLAEVEEANAQAIRQEEEAKSEAIRMEIINFLDAREEAAARFHEEQSRLWDALSDEVKMSGAVSRLYFDYNY